MAPDNDNKKQEKREKKKHKKKQEYEEPADPPNEARKMKMKNKKKQEYEEPADPQPKRRRRRRRTRNESISSLRMKARVWITIRSLGRSKIRETHNVVTDEFQRVPMKEAKVAIDSRFGKMLKDKNFDSSSAPVDKRGRLREEKERSLLDRYYHNEDEEERESASEMAASEDEGKGEESSSTSTDDEDEFDFDGHEQVDLVGGYYDAGDNVKYGLPMAFTVTTLAWAALHYKNELQATGELQNAHSAIRWGTDYFLKCSVKKNQLYVQVGDPVADHECWMRPENMKTPRTLYKISKNMPGTEIAAETAAALAASSMVFRKINYGYSRRLVNRAKLLFEFAKQSKGTYDGECPFYCSFSGYNDELLWASSWLYLATKKTAYKNFISYEAVSSSVVEFSWDLKFAGAQVLLSDKNLTAQGGLQNFKTQADKFVCQILPDTPFRTIRITPGGMIHFRDGANTQYVTGTALLFMIYSDILAKNHQTVICGAQEIQPARLMQFAKQQIDYILGSNPKGRSYMVGFGMNPPAQPHHRGASVPVLPPNTTVSCGLSFVHWCNNDSPNIHELTGAIVGGPDANDNFEDKRMKSSYTEPCTYINSLAVGPLAKLAVLT